MRRYSTPRIPIDVGADLTRCPVVIATLEDKAGNQVHVDNRGGQMEITPTQIFIVLSQAQTGFLEPGPIHLEVNAIDSGNNRLPSTIDEGWMEDNLLGVAIYV